MFRVTREIEFCYGHRLLNYDGKCRHLHGHNGRAVITLQGAELDSRGMLVDFGEIKQKVQQWIDENLDHNMLLCRDDPSALAAATRRASLRDGLQPHGREYRPADLRARQGSRSTGRRSRALGDRALLLDLCLDDMNQVDGMCSAPTRVSRWAWPWLSLTAFFRLARRWLSGLIRKPDGHRPTTRSSARAACFEDRHGVLLLLGEFRCAGTVDLEESGA